MILKREKGGELFLFTQAQEVCKSNEVGTQCCHYTDLFVGYRYIQCLEPELGKAMCKMNHILSQQYKDIILLNKNGPKMSKIEATHQSKKLKFKFSQLDSKLNYSEFQ